MVNNRNLVTIRRRSEFALLREKGKKVYPSRWMCLNLHQNTEGEPRFGWTISKKVGGAVVRNRLRRWCREFFRAQLNIDGNATKNIDLNVVLRARKDNFYRNLDYNEFAKVLDKGWRAAQRCSQ